MYVELTRLWQNAFKPSMDPSSVDIPSQATCTTCTFAEDFSNYWGQYNIIRFVSCIFLTSFSTSSIMMLPSSRIRPTSRRGTTSPKYAYT